VVLGAGFFTTQKSQEVVHSGVTQAASNIVVKGEVYGIKNASGNFVDFLRFDVGLAAGGLPVDMAKATMILSTSEGVQTLTKGDLDSMPAAGSGMWAITETSPSSENDEILKAEEAMTIYVAPNISVTNLTPRVQFNLEVKPEIGASLGVQRTVPPSLTNVTLLY